MSNITQFPSYRQASDFYNENIEGTIRRFNSYGPMSECAEIETREVYRDVVALSREIARSYSFCKVYRHYRHVQRNGFVDRELVDERTFNAIISFYRPIIDCKNRIGNEFVPFGQQSADELGEAFFAARLEVAA